MLKRLLIAALLCWGFIASPSLCRAGMLEHDCACGVSSDCSHEESCTDDPCAIAKPATEGVAFLKQLASPPALLAGLPLLACPYPSALEVPVAPVRWVQSMCAALRAGALPLLV